MAETYYRIKLSTLTEIGDAIRAKSGATGDIAVTNLATSILNLSPADGADEWDGTGIVIAPIEPVEPNTFTINGTSYQMENRMTWYAWTRSDYNTDGFSCANENDYVYEAESRNKVTDAEGNDVLGTTYIVEGGAYLIKEEATTDELAGTWFLNSSITIPTDDFSVNMFFELPNTEWYKSGNWGFGNINQYWNQFDATKLYFCDTGGDDYTMYENGNWLDENYRTIVFTGNYGDPSSSGWDSSRYVSEEVALAWFKANATKQSASNLISFTIDGTSYQAEEGMTWGEWVASDYNTGDFVANGNTIYENSNLGKFVKYTPASTVLTTDTIISNHAYFTSGAGGAN